MPSGHSRLEHWARDALSDDDRELIIDLAGSSYLSSGGIRVFAALKKEMKRRNGRFALASVGDYPMKVLEMAGFTSVLEIFPVHRCGGQGFYAPEKGSLPLWRAVPQEDHRGRGAARPSSRPVPHPLASPRVTGNLDNVLYSRITQSDIKQKKFSEVTYSLGLGALGAVWKTPCRSLAR